MSKSTQPLEAKIRSAMAAVRGAKADPDRRPAAEHALADLHQYASGEEYPNKQTILSAVDRAWEAFRSEDHAGTIRSLSGALIAVTRI